MAAKFRKGDEVIILTGKDKGKKGAILKMLDKGERALVQGVNMVKRHMRPSQMQAGGIVNKEAALHVSNLSHVDPKSGDATRIGFKSLEDGTKVRFAKKSGEIIKAVGDN